MAPKEGIEAKIDEDKKQNKKKQKQKSKPTTHDVLQDSDLNLIKSLIK